MIGAPHARGYACSDEAGPGVIRDQIAIGGRAIAGFESRASAAVLIHLVAN
ncbi:hypothetical protein BSIN_2862 [Burkholderia singularis]|uniref:Uncharacterized protein n=1 Tax=Burkholderia singularis TaxID=1503053 RepID=A0A238H3A2_9BURK|nr:hypothetical protein BSIN_2862 [Burkholderia singularis]